MENLQVQQQQILTQLVRSAPTNGWKVEVFGRIASTNQYLLDCAAGSDIHGHICVALEQTQGRGRLGRKWLGQKTQTLMFSVGWRNNQPRPMSLIAGYALLQALHKLSVADLSLKWPNDVLIHGAKLAGVLVESRASQAVIGVGLNLDGAAGLSVALNREVADLSAYSFDEAQLVAEICLQLEKVMHQYDTLGAQKFALAFDAWHEYHGCDVWLIDGKDDVAATVLGVAPDGALKVRVDNQMRLVNAGEVSLRK